jgi:hypothetical protein
VMNSWQATEPEPPQKSTGSQHIAHDGLVLLLQRRGLRPNQRAVGIHVAELVADRHGLFS